MSRSDDSRETELRGVGWLTRRRKLITALIAH